MIAKISMENPMKMRDPMERRNKENDCTRKCAFFGAMTEERRKKRSVCKRCKRLNPDVYNDCVKETFNTLGTEVVFGINGEIVHNRVILNEERENMNENMNENVENTDNNVEKKVVVPTVANGEDSKKVEINGEEVRIPKTGKGSRAHVKETKGVLAMSMRMLKDGASEQDVLIELIQKYIDNGKTSKKAKHNALSIMHHAKKRVASETVAGDENSGKTDG